MAAVEEQIAEDIISAARKLFMQYGFKSVTMDDIARELSISKKTIYLYFKDKKEIALKAVQKQLHEVKCEIESSAQKGNNIIEEMYYMSKCFREHVETMNPAVMHDMWKYHKEAWNTFLEYKNEFIFNHMVDMLERGKQEGCFRADIDPQILARMRIEQITMAFDPEVFPKNEFDHAQIQRQLFLHFLYGILTDKGREHLKQYFK